MKNTSIRIEPLVLATQNIPESTNMLFFFDKTKISAYQTKINDFLNASGGVFLFANLDAGDVGNTSVGNTFGLVWGDITNLPGRFGNVYDASLPGHFVARYYANISTRHLQDVQSETFTAFLPTGISGQNDQRNVVRTDNDRAYVRTNEVGQGRTVWFQDYARSDHDNQFTKQIDNLTKASIMWASGERSKLDMIKKTPAPVNFKSSIFVYDGDNYIIELTIWRIFF